MEVTLTPDQQAFIQLAVADGRLRSEEEAVAEALALWEERERNRIAFLATLTDARASLARGEGRELTEDSLQELAKSVKERGRARRATELGGWPTRNFPHLPNLKTSGAPSVRVFADGWGAKTPRNSQMRYPFRGRLQSANESHAVPT
jgi:Arc/MetJ-type ribon-helix-helix transcriptional regulator